MKARCMAPMCYKPLEITFKQWLAYKFKGEITHLLCPEHLERMTAGDISDNDPTTNPDLEK